MPVVTENRRLEGELPVLTPEILARVGHDMPPAPQAQAKPGRRKPLPRELRETRRQMLYHWF